MPYISRQTSGEIDSLHRHPSATAQEFLPDTHADVLAFVGASEPSNPGFSRLDADFVRVIEDVIDTLIGKNVFNITDLPAEAQAKLLARKGFRERVSKNSLKLFETSTFRDVI